MVLRAPNPGQVEDMSDGFMYWYRNDWSPVAAERLLESLREGRISLTNPGTEMGSWVSKDPESYGHQILVTADDLAAMVRNLEEDELNFQLWLDDTTDVFTRIRKTSSMEAVVEFSLDGLDADQQKHVMAVFMDIVKRQPEGTVGFVVDRVGATVDVDWDAAVDGQPVSLPTWPDAVGLPAGHQVTCSEPSPASPRRHGSISVIEQPDLSR